MELEGEMYEVFQEYPVRIVVDEQSEPWFCGCDVAKLLNYKAPNVAVQNNCRMKRVMIFTPKDFRSSSKLAFISQSDTENLIKKKGFAPEVFISCILMGKNPELKQITSTAEYAVINLDKSQQEIIKGLQKYKITVEKI